MDSVEKIEDPDGLWLWQLPVDCLVSTHIFLAVCKADSSPALL